ncbi:MAG: 3'-5' exonuclease, partial [Henriciella sp.]
RGYRWRPEDLENGKVWWTITSNPEAELAWLAKDVYQAAIDLPVSSVNAMNRYSESVWTG